MDNQTSTASVRSTSSGVDLKSIENKNVPLPKSGLDVSSIIANTQVANKALEDQTRILDTNYRNAADMANANADLYKSIGDNAVLIDSVKQNAELKTQQNKISAANKLGTNVGVQGEVLSTLADTIQQSYAQREAALKNIEAKQNSSFFDNPLGWIVNQFTINDDIKAHNIADERLTNAAQQYQTLNTLTQTAAVTQNAITESISQATIDASAQNIKNQSAITANQEALKGIVYNTEAIKASMQLTKDQLQNSFAVFNANKAEQQIKISLAHLAMQREEFDWKKREKEGKDADDTYLIDLINEGRKQRLGPQADLLSPGTVRANTALSLLKSNSPAGKEFQVDYQIGEQSRATGVKVLAPTPAQFAEMVGNRVGFNLPESTRYVQKLILDSTAEVAAMAQKTGEKDPTLLKDRINKLVQAKIDMMAKKIKPGDPENIFNIGDLRVITALPSVKDLPVVTQVIAPQLKNGADLSNPSKVFELVSKAVMSGQLTYAQALELSTVYQQGVSTNMEARQLPTLGIAPKWSYNVEVDTDPYSMYGGKTVVDLTKPDAVGRTLNKRMADHAFREFPR